MHWLCGAIAKTIVNMTLIPIPDINIYGAAIGSLICQIIFFAIGFVTLIKNIKLELPFKKFVLKPVIATIMMCICTISAYNCFSNILGSRLSTIIALAIAVITYVLSVIVMKIFNEEEISMLPSGGKVYMWLVKFGIYKA